MKHALNTKTTSPFPNQSKRKSKAGGEKQKSRDARDAEDNGVFQHGMVHDEMMVHFVGFFTRHHALLFQIAHDGSAITDANEIAHEPHVGSIVGKAKDTH